jgi:hypothetical protein
MATKSKDDSTSISVMAIDRGVVTYCVLGDMPLIFNQINEKARHELLMPSPKKTAADKQANLKHDPLAEFVWSTYRSDGDGPTRLYFPATGFKAAICTAALDMPGTKKAQIGRLVWVDGERVDIYGIPSLFMRPVRSADMNRTPDIRTRAILPRWACRLTVKYASPLLKEPQISNLLAAAGIFVGVGDYRQEKGKGSYGQFSLVSADDPTFLDLVQNEGREAQDAALKVAAPHDPESRELLEWYLAERGRRANASPIVRTLKEVKVA